MHAENEKILRDAAKNKTYLACGFLGDDIDDGGGPEKKQQPQCQLTNCNNPKSHMWNGSKNAGGMVSSQN
eukprot:10239077-Ditylum_brightwellii.AAC.1